MSDIATAPAYDPWGTLEGPAFTAGCAALKSRCDMARRCASFRLDEAVKRARPEPIGGDAGIYLMDSERSTQRATMSRRARLSLLLAAGLAAPIGAWGSAAAGAAPPSVYADYHPSFSDLMTTAVQPRHIKLGLALRAGNWTYAAFAVGEMRGAFNRIARSIPSYEGRDTREFVTMIDDPLAKAQAAIAARDPRQADVAYAELTQTCNACHAASGRPYIAIRAPSTSMFPDQDFSPRP